MEEEEEKRKTRTRQFLDRKRRKGNGLILATTLCLDERFICRDLLSYPKGTRGNWPSRERKIGYRWDRILAPET